MRLSSISNFNTTKATPSFGMAKLTAKGVEAANAIVGDFPEFINTVCYKKHQLPAMLRKINNGTEVDLAKFFEAGNTLYPSNNKSFIKKQITSFFEMKAIKSFLKKQTKDDALSTKGRQLVDELIYTFDFNISNPAVSSKSGRKILSLIEPYIPTDEYTKRVAIVSSKVLSK